MRNLTTQSRGFTLVELLVTLGIFMVLTGVVLANYRTYDTNAIFANASEDIVLALRQAQVYGVGSKGEGNIFTMPYGVYFDTTTPNQIIIFADANSDGVYSLGQDNVVETIKWKTPIAITGLKCGGFICSVLNITFKRPNPDAIISYGLGSSYNNAEITIMSGIKASIIYISKAGQISLQ